MKLRPNRSNFDLSPTLKANELVNKIRASGKTILHMGCGESPFPVPMRLQNALKNNTHRKSYVATGGLPALKQAALSYYCDKFKLNENDFESFVGPGSKLILYSLQLAIEGDVILPVPSWVSYAPQAYMIDTDVLKLPVSITKDGMIIDPKILQRVIDDGRAQGFNPSKIILNYPSNPIGLTIPKDNLKQIADTCIQNDIFIISDEIYALVDFNNTHTSIARFAPEHTAVTTALSKHMSLGGWRLGIGLIPKAFGDLHSRLCTIASETWSCVSEPIQHAAIEAFQNHDDIENHVSQCTQIHAFINTKLASHLNEADIDVFQPQGAFYHYPDFTPYKDALSKLNVTTSQDLSDYLIEEYGLVSLPGYAFGEDDIRLTLRLSGCDYDGEKVLQAYNDGAALNDDFIENYAPNIRAQGDVFKSFTARLKSL